ncbi:hypothetical protein NDU88_003515 [Pleurodeles waltl]|uniref:Uncharacterized protein n=1 Tax=Pleurodeles waltl TaxID=8319 RepID=A0AAV7RD33_PLEWA|nr:hypothetical protein NDU88_003515 [Pleurodeles waltl]
MAHCVAKQRWSAADTAVVNDVPYESGNKGEDARTRRRKVKIVAQPSSQCPGGGTGGSKASRPAMFCGERGPAREIGGKETNPPPLTKPQKRGKDRKGVGEDPQNQGQRQEKTEE